MEDRRACFFFSERPRGAQSPSNRVESKKLKHSPLWHVILLFKNSQKCCVYITICIMFFSACFFVVDVSKFHVENQNKSKLNSMRSGSMEKMQIISTTQKQINCLAADVQSFSSYGTLKSSCLLVVHSIRLQLAFALRWTTGRFRS